jgi:hypothetical protein
MSNTGVTTDQILRAVYDHTDMSSVEWKSINEYGENDLFGIKYSDFEKAIRAASLLTTTWIIRTKWDNLVAQNVIISQVMKGKRPAAGVMCLNRVKSIVPSFRSQTFVPCNVRTLDTYEKFLNKQTNKQSNEERTL